MLFYKENYTYQEFVIILQEKISLVMTFLLLHQPMLTTHFPLRKYFQEGIVQYY